MANEELPPSEMMGCVSFSHKECFGVFDCVTAGMPLLQGLAFRLSVMFVWAGLPLSAKSCKCSSFVTCDSE